MFTSIPGSDTLFVAEEHFGVGKHLTGKIDVTPAFAQEFLEGEGEIKSCFFHDTQVSYVPFREDVKVSAIVLLGGEKKAELTLYHLWSLITRQLAGEAGILMLGCIPNIFHIKNRKGELRPVSATRNSANWSIDLCSDDWIQGSRMFFHHR